MKFAIGMFMFLLVVQAAHGVVLRGESREQITSPKDDRAKKIGLLEAWNNSRPNHRSYCSASNVSKRYLITAAHCVVDIATGKVFDNVVYYPRHVHEKTRSPSRIFIKKGYLLKQYLNENKKLVFDGNASLSAITKPMIENDIALLEAFSDAHQKHAGERYGWFGFQSVPDSVYSQDILDVSMRSYPGDKEQGTLWYEDCYLMHNQGNIGKISCDVWRGASGAAITMKKSDWKYAKVIAIASAENGKDKVNQVTLLTRPFAEDILAIISRNANAGELFETAYFNTKRFYYFYVQNRCDKEIKVATRIQKPDGNWATYENYNIKKDQRTQSLPGSKNAIYYYFAQSQNGSDWWGDEVNGAKKVAFGENRWFYKKELPKDVGNVRWGDYYRQVTCD